MKKDDSGQPIERPDLTPAMVRYETDLGPFCPICDSSQKWKWGWLGKLFRREPLGCMSHGCPNYWQRKQR